MSGVILVTGASRGIGAAIARLAGKAGYAVGVNYNSHADEAEAVCADIRQSGATAVALQADMANEAAIRQMFADADRTLGPLTSLVNNAGGIVQISAIADIDRETVERIVAINLSAPIYCCREGVRRMSTARGGRGGAIVNISSMAAVLGGLPHEVHYAATKGGVDALTIGLAREVAKEGIRVNAIRPGVIDTPIHERHGGQEFLTNFSPNLPMNRPGTAEEVAEAALWLLSPAASYVTGAILNVSGGR